MRLKNHEIDRFLENATSPYALYLFYGPDEGLIRERSAKAAQTVLKNNDDPFALTDLNEEEYRSDPARLGDEYGAVSMFGGQRIIRIRFKTDRYGKTMKSLLEQLDAGTLKGDARIIIEAGDLKPSSILRKSVEKAKSAVALPCYADDSRSLGHLITSILQENKLQYTNDIIQILASELGNDRAVTRQELEKLILYKKAGGGENAKISEEDIDAAIARSNTLGLQDVAYGAANGDIQKMTQSLKRCYLDAINPASVIRALTGHMEQLYRVLCLIEKGTNIKTATDSLKPRIHFQRRTAFEGQLRLWSAKRCERALSLLYDAEIKCKSSGMPAETICAQTALRLARAARLRPTAR